MMAKINVQQAVLNKRSTKALMAVAFAAIAYGFASLAIDSGSLFEYALTIIFLVWAIKNAKRSVLGKR